MRRFLYVPDSILCSVHLSSVACYPLFDCCTDRSTLCNSSVLAHVSDKTAAAALALGSSLCVIKFRHGSGAWFVNQECW